MAWMLFIEGKQISLQGVLSSFRHDPNFCLGSQPSGIPLIFAWIALWFSTHQGSLYRLCIHYFSLFLLSLLFQHSCFPFLSFLLFFFFRYGCLKGFDYFDFHLSLLVYIYQSIIVTINSKTGRWILMSSLSS